MEEFMWREGRVEVKGSKCRGVRKRRGGGKED